MGVWGGGRGLSERTFTVKTGDFGAKKITFFFYFLNEDLFYLPRSGWKSGTKNCIFLNRGSFGAAKVENVVLRSGQGQTIGAYTWHIPVLSLNGSTPLGHQPRLGEPDIDRRP